MWVIGIKGGSPGDGLPPYGTFAANTPANEHVNRLPRTATVLVNPAARGAHRLDAERAMRRIQQFGVEARLVTSSSEQHWIEAAAASAAQGDDLLLAVGGDGSLRLAAGALAGSATALAPIPAGTANVWAREARIPRRQDAAIDAVLGGQVVAVDLGYAGDEPFLLMAGIGWDAAIAARVGSRMKRRIGSFAYVYEAARALSRLRPTPLDWTIDGHPASRRAGLIVIGNTRLYGGVVQFTPEASAVDGRLDVCAVSPRRPGQGTFLAAKLGMRRLDGPGVLRARATEVDIQTAGLPFQLDGDPVGETPARFTIRPAALRMRIPPGPLPAFLQPAGYSLPPLA